MNENITYKKIGNKEIYILGTAHVSSKSADDVNEIINEVNPDCICIELDAKRYEGLKSNKKFEDKDIIEVVKGNQVGYLLVNIILSSFQKRIAEQSDIKSGQEMITAINYCDKTKTKLELIDRDIQTTFKRIYRKHSFFDKMKLMYSIITSIFDDSEISVEEIENLKQQDMLQAALSEVSKEFKTLSEVLIFERDKILAHKIKNADGTRIVAVVGAAHVGGILQAIDQEYSIDEMMTIPNKTFFSKIIGWIIPAIIVGLIVITFFNSAQVGLESIASWFLINGVLSAIGVLICFGHPLSILTAFVVAPFTSLNPLLAAGWFAGLSEAYFRKPKVKDFNNLSTDVNTFKGFYKNRVTHILLVVIMANVFSTVGTLIGGIDIVQSLLNLFN